MVFSSQFYTLEHLLTSLRSATVLFLTKIKRVILSDFEKTTVIRKNSLQVMKKWKILLIFAGIAVPP
jgi:hypothetical protein